MKKKCIAFLLTSALTLSSTSIIASAKYDMNNLNNLSDAQKTILRIELSVFNPEKNPDGEKYNSILGVDLYDLSKDELNEIIDFLNEEDTAVEIETETHIDFDVFDGQLTSEGSAQFQLYSTVNSACRELEYMTQTQNPEISFDADTQHLDYARFYISYYADCTKEEAQDALESNTDELLYVVENTFPNVEIDSLVFYYAVPAINKESLYAATYYCNLDEDSTLVRGDGSGLIYDK